MFLRFYQNLRLDVLIMFVLIKKVYRTSRDFTDCVRMNLRNLIIREGVTICQKILHSFGYLDEIMFRAAVNVHSIKKKSKLGQSQYFFIFFFRSNKEEVIFITNDLRGLIFFIQPSLTKVKTTQENFGMRVCISVDQPFGVYWQRRK